LVTQAQAVTQGLAPKATQEQPATRGVLETKAIPVLLAMLGTLVSKEILDKAHRVIQA